MAIKPSVVTLMPIKNMNRALRFYRGALGASMGERATGSMRDMWASVKLGGTDIWLITPAKRERRTLAYTVLLVKNIRAATKALLKKRVRFERAVRMSPESKIEGPIAWESFGAGAYFKDSEGNLLMLWQNIPPM